MNKHEIILENGNKMKVAISLNQDGSIYLGNPWTAPSFVVYEIKQDQNIVKYKKIHQKENPWLSQDESVICDPMMCEDGCSDIIKEDLNHLADHYIILEVINGCTALLSNLFCSNLEKVLTNGGIDIYPYPVFIKDPDIAINSFIVSNFTPKETFNGENLKIIKLDFKQ